MNENNRQYILELVKKMEGLYAKQQTLSNEINEMRALLLQLQQSENATPISSTEKEKPSVEKIVIDEFPKTVETPIVENISSAKPMEEIQMEPAVVTTNVEIPKFAPGPKPKMTKSGLEKFIGENLISKIGIVIMLIGIAIGVKYSIDHDLISPVGRIVLGYVASIALLFVGFRLKEKYNSFSAVLVSGAMAATYFVTYAAYSYYDLFPRILTFVLMLAFTGFTVFAALQYNKQVIAHFGLVGAYSIPFLLNDNSGNIAGFLTYISIINIGMLFIAFYRKWQGIFYMAFGVTWFIVLAASIFQNKDHLFGTYFGFSTFFFLLFYTMFIVSTIQKGTLTFGTVTVLLSNTFVYYGIGYALISDNPSYSNYVGLFTVLNGLIHFVAALFIYKRQLAEKKTLYLLLGLVMVFITIAIPVQLDGNWVTLIWIAEATLLYWIGSKKQVLYFERLSYVLMLLAFFSLLQDWSECYYPIYTVDNRLASMRPIWNVYFLTSIMGIVAFYLIYKWQKTVLTNPEEKITQDKKLMSFVVPAILLLLLYLGPFMEMKYGFDLQMDKLLITRNIENYQVGILDAKMAIVMAVYSILYVLTISLLNNWKIKSTMLSSICGVLAIIVLLVYLTGGLMSHSVLLDNYMQNHIGAEVFLIRYFSIACVIAMLYFVFYKRKEKLLNKNMEVVFHIGINLVAIVLLSSELVQWLTLSHSKSEYKLGLSILWGCYALAMIAYGIGKQRQHLRILGMVLFGITLLKLFFYDVAYMSTIAKTALFVILGVLLLVVSFLYNKYNGKISDDK